MSIDSITALITADKLLSSLRKKIKSGKGTFSDTFRYSLRSSQLMGELFSGEVLDMPEEERRSACTALLHDRYTDINALLDTVQRTLDKAQGLNLNPRHAPFDSERAAQIGDSLTDKTVPDETIVRRARSAPVTAARSMHDDFIEENAAFRSKAGLQCYINRETDGKCCKWCSKMAGRYIYDRDIPQDIFRRHDNCGCSVTYECGRQRQNVWTKKTWEAPEADAGAPPPTVFTQEQARKLEREKLAQIVHKPSIDKLGESGIIKSIDVDDYDLVTYGKGIAPEVNAVILNTMKKCEKDGGFVISEISTSTTTLPDTHGTPILQIEPLPNGLLKLNVNAEFLSGKTLAEINRAIENTEINVAKSLEEAIVHESGHAISIKGKKPDEIVKFYQMLKDKGMPGVSTIALEDGAECLAELEVLRYRKEKVSKELADFYEKYMGRKYL